MMKEDFSINFSGLTHDHATLYNNKTLNDNQKENNQDDSSCSTIAILRRHPMYDSLVLVKKYRNCLNGYSLEFPSDNLNDELVQQDTGNTINCINVKERHEKIDSNPSNNENSIHSKSCNRRRLVSRFLDGDDPMYQACSISGTEMSVNDSSELNYNNTHSSSSIHNSSTNSSISSSHPFAQQIDDKGELCELVHVPINGLMDRLRNYTETGVAVDSRVYAFAMGLKTAERILATSSMKEPQETPI